jgi:mitogen-activated protein kinase organizer 1
MGPSVALPTKEAAVLRGHEGAVLAVRFNHDGKYCLSCGKDRTLRLWNPHNGLHIKTYSGHAREVRDVAVSRYPNFSLFWILVFSEIKGSVSLPSVLWFLLLLLLLYTAQLQLHEQWLWILSSWGGGDKSDNAKLSSCGGDRQLFYWDVTTGRIIRKFRGHDSEVCFITNSGSLLNPRDEIGPLSIWVYQNRKSVPSYLPLLTFFMNFLLSKLMAHSFKMRASAAQGF